MEEVSFLLLDSINFSLPITFFCLFDLIPNYQSTHFLLLLLLHPSSQFGMFSSPFPSVTFDFTVVLCGSPRFVLGVLSFGFWVFPAWFYCFLFGISTGLFVSLWIICEKWEVKLDDKVSLFFDCISPFQVSFHGFYLHILDWWGYPVENLWRGVTGILTFWWLSILFEFLKTPLHCWSIYGQLSELYCCPLESMVSHTLFLL